jgi:hypothetical protein
MPRPMRRRFLLSGVTLVVGLLALSGSLASASSSQSAYTKADVVQAFTGVKIHLFTTEAGNASQSVTALTAVVSKKLTHKESWAVAVWVYDTEGSAFLAYKSGAPQWRDNGIPSMRVGNIVVTVVPKGRAIGSTGPQFPMPVLVRNALKALTHG